jgi:general secretion pathway protein D
LKRLDVQRAQVLIEASIVEVTLNNDLQYGLEWSFNNNHIDINGRNGGYTGTGTVNGGSGTTTPSGGFTWALGSSSTAINATLSALADKSLVKVISSPSLLVLDNQTAAIQVGNQEPVSTGSTSYGTVSADGTPITSSSIQYMNTGVMLGVTPSVTAGDLVTMDINQMVTDANTTLSNVGGESYPSFMQRQINTEVAVRSGETVVLGGLIKDSSQSGISGVPFLSSIPIIGALFGQHGNSKQRTELLVIITPRVLRSDEDARAVSREMRDRMHGLTAGDLPVIPATTP